MKRACRHIVVIGLILIAASFGLPPEVRPAKLLQQMHDSIKNIKTVRVHISALEREESSFRTAYSEIKLQINPRRLYFKNPVKKIEILFNAGQMNNKALVKPNTFPYVTLSLDPTGSLMRKNQHYTIHEIGFDFVGKAVAFIISKDKEGLNNFKYYGKVVKNGCLCYLLEYENKNFNYVDYVPGESETVSSIANKLGVNEYLVRYKNGLINHFDFLKAGKAIKVPNLFCKKATLYIDEKLMLPVSAALVDDIGIFENYDFTKIEVNKGIKDDEFSKDYKDYHF